MGLFPRVTAASTNVKEGTAAIMVQTDGSLCLFLLKSLSFLGKLKAFMIKLMLTRLAVQKNSPPGGC